MGVVIIGEQETLFSGDQSFAGLDFGRGIWPRHCRWNWGSASRWQNGRLVGLNLGGQWTDGAGSTENGVCVDGRLHKLSTDLTWQYDKVDFMQPWRISGADGRLTRTFTPSWNGWLPATSSWCARRCINCSANTVGASPPTRVK